MGKHRSTLISSEERINKYYKPDHTKKIILVTPKDRFVRNFQVIITNRDQGRKVGLDISRFFTDYDSNIIGNPHNTLLNDERWERAFNNDLDKAPNLIFTQLSAHSNYSKTH